MPALNAVKYLGLLLLLLVITGVSDAVETFAIDAAEIVNSANGYSLNAQITYPLTARVKEAIDNSVPVVFSQQFKLERTTSLWGDFWQWQTIVWSTEMRYEIRYHPLSEQYIVKDLATLHQNSFPVLAEALQVLGTVSSMVLPPQFLANKENLTLLIRSEIDLHALPTPMRPGVLISRKWQLASNWVAVQWQ